MDKINTYLMSVIIIIILFACFLFFMIESQMYRDKLIKSHTRQIELLQLLIKGTNKWQLTKGA